MGWLESLIYGFVSGISEFFPISSAAHQQLMMHLFGIDVRDPVRDFFVHLSMALALLMSCRPYFELLQRERPVHRGRSPRHTTCLLHDRRLVSTAAFPMLIGMFLLRYVFRFNDTLLLAAVFMVINGIIFFLPEHMAKGNKDSRHMSSLDSVLIGLSGAGSVFCGLSRIGITYSVSIARGASKKHALNWSLALSLLALICLTLMDIIAMFTTGAAGFWNNFFSYLLSGVTTYVGGFVGISFMRLLAARPSSVGIAYYCWGTALLSFILYLNVS